VANIKTRDVRSAVERNDGEERSGTIESVTEKLSIFGFRKELVPKSVCGVVLRARGWEECGRRLIVHIETRT